MDALAFHKKLKGKIEVMSRVRLKTRAQLSLAYTPGVAEVSKAIAANPQLAYDYTRKHNTVAVVTDGSAVLGLGNIGAPASLPVMEGKALLFKELAGVDAFPIALNTQDTDEIVLTVEIIAPMFGGINLEDISAPRCFEIEKRLRERLNIPVFHDDQHGTAMVVLAGLMNALTVAKKELLTVKIVISGAGAAGQAITRLLLAAGASDVTVLDSQGIVHKKRAGMAPDKVAIAEITNPRGLTGSYAQALAHADVFIGVSRAGLITPALVQSMAERAIVFALANPEPEIAPRAATAAGALVVATGRSDFPNQVNNTLIFPGFFRGLLDGRLVTITEKMQFAAAAALAACVRKPSTTHILPDPLDRRVAKAIAKAVRAAA